MRRKGLVLPALFVVFCLVLPAAVLAGARRQQSASGVETLEAYGLVSGGSSAGIYEGRFFSDIWKEDLGIVFNAVSGQDLNAIIASGNLPDILFVQAYTAVDTMIKAGLLVNWDDHRDKLPNVYGPYLANAVQYRRDKMSNGTGNLYGMGADICSNPALGTVNLGPYIRWDYYKELGMPVVADLEDYLPLLKRMQDAHPTNEAGQRVYAFSLWSDWGSAPPSDIDAFVGIQKYGFTEFDLVRNSARSIVDENSAYKRSLQFYFNANQLGLLDPDSITQGWNDYLAKGKAGRVLFSSWPWGVTEQFRTPEREAAGIGYGLVPFTAEKVVDTKFGGQLTGDARSWVVSKNTKHLDKALAFIDFMYSFDGILLMQQGRRGVMWDLDENGEPYYTRRGWDVINGKEEYPGWLERGGIPPGIAWRAIHPVYNRQLNGQDWVKKDYAPADNTLVADWKRLMNATDDIDYFTRHNMAIAVPSISLSVPDNIQIIQNRVNEVIGPLAWQMIYAKDQAEFDRLWAQLVEQAKGRGLDQADQWYRQAYTEAVADYAKYTK
ncbi:MAG: extracellular solute-binding protein [Treponema sp.]|nr:extracellular solute-binding protein [Treponema sp.]